MEDLLNKDGIAWIIEHLLSQAEIAVREYDNKDELYQGRMLAYYEMLDAIKSRIQVRGGEPDEYGLGFKLESLAQEMRKRIKKA